MLNNRCRTLSIALAAGALTMFGAGAALAAGAGPGAPGNGGNALCSVPGSPLATSPACSAAHPRPGQRALGDSGSGAAPALPPNGTGDKGDSPGPLVVCEAGSPLTGSPFCPKPAQP